jgi:hypothetical protein
MVTIDRVPGPAGVVRVEIPYTVTGALDLRDSRRSLFEPMEATVCFRDGKPWWVRIKGRRHDQYRRWTETGISIHPDGTPESDRKNQVIPPFVDLLVQQASQHPAVLAFAAPATA